MKKLVSIFMGSDSDLPVVKEGVKLLEKFGIPFEINIASAHRSPKYLRSLVSRAHSSGVEVFIAAAGGAAHLPGVIASETICPVIGIPIVSGPLNGFDSLLSIVQMPGGIPVATVSIGSAGAKNAAILACEILALKHKKYKVVLEQYRAEMEKDVISKSRIAAKK
jgi:phosphoribosylaminoimidazole carboxylase PurE protein